MVSDLSGWDDKITYDSAGAGVSAAAPLDLAHLLEMEAGVPAIAWVSDRGVEVRFLRPAELAGAADRTLVSEPGTGKSSAQIAGGVVGFGVAWQEGAAGHAVIKLRGLPTDEAPLGAEITVGRIGYSNHSPSIAACRIPALDSAAAFGIDVAWVESAEGDTSGFGRILLRKFRFADDDAGANDAAGSSQRAPGVLLVPANDNITEISPFGREPVISTLATGDTLIAWIGADSHVHGHLLPANSAASNDAGDAASAGARPDYEAVNAALADMGPVAPSPGSGRRLQATELGQGGFAIMWLALGASGGFELRGNLFGAPDTGLSQQPAWTPTAIAPVPLPSGSEGEFAIAAVGEGDADLLAAYSVANPATNALEVLGRRIAGTDAAGGRGLLGSEFLIDPSAGDTLGAVRGLFGDRSIVADPAAADAGLAEADAPQPTPQAAASAEATGEAVAVPAAGPAAQSVEWVGVADAASSVFSVAATPESEIAPQVVATEAGFVVSWQTVNPDGTVHIRLSMFDSTGQRVTASDGQTTVFDVATGAKAGVAPGIAALGDGFVTAWVDSETGTLRIRGYDSDGDALGPPEGYAVIAGQDISEFAIVGESSDGADATDGDPSDLPWSELLALLWVQGADASGYGNIMLQRYGLSYDSSGSMSVPVALGPDGHLDNDDDPAPLTAGAGDDEEVVGRGVQAAGLEGGKLAVVWIERDAAGEHIHGTVLQPEDGGQVLRIDLSQAFSGHAVVEGTKPILSSADDGSLLVSWLQYDPEGGYNVMSALYAAAGPTAWSTPSAPIELRHFNSRPTEFSVAVTGDADALFLTWRESSSGSGSGGVYGQAYDTDGTAVGRQVKLSESGSGSLGQDGVVASAGLADGRVVVVFNEQDRDGDLDVEASVFDVSSAGLGAPAAPPPLEPPPIKNTELSVVEDATDGILIDVGATTAGALRLVQVNDTDITTGTPVRLANGFASVRDDGNLVFSADADFAGAASFTYTVENGAGARSTTTVNLTILPVNEAPTGILLASTSVPEDEVGAVVGPVAVFDPDIADTHTITVSDDRFEIVGGNLKLKSGISLDLDGGEPVINLSLTASDDSGAVLTQPFAIGVIGKGAPAGAPEAASQAQAAAFDALAFDPAGDTFMFNPAYGNEAARQTAYAAGDVVDLSSSGYATFEALKAAGALAQVGDDVVITLNPTDPNSDKVVVKSVSLSALDPNDFKFA